CVWMPGSTHGPTQDQAEPVHDQTPFPFGTSPSGSLITRALSPTAGDGIVARFAFVATALVTVDCAARSTTASRPARTSSFTGSFAPDAGTPSTRKSRNAACSFA